MQGVKEGRKEGREEGRKEGREVYSPPLEGAEVGVVEEVAVSLP